MGRAISTQGVYGQNNGGQFCTGAGVRGDNNSNSRHRRDGWITASSGIGLYALSASAPAVYASGVRRRLATAAGIGASAARATAAGALVHWAESRI